ncbi:MAG: 2'-5' RNA ligase family protein [Oscillospiraceae bacterium]|jgi:2'-5' RNA ligase|nr:2'-5' RNA ligase family protein [Oscillospiraceae bacterium]
MQYAIELFYDKETEKQIYDLVQKIADAGLSTKFLDFNTRPHLTLACFNDVDELKCKELLNIFASAHQTLPAYIGSVGMFTDTKVIFLSPIMTKSMYQFQSELHECMIDFDTTGWEWYCPERWVPHCTVALTGEDADDAFYKASELILHEFKKLSGKYTSIGLVKVTFPVEEIYTVNLSE